MMNRFIIRTLWMGLLVGPILGLQLPPPPETAMPKTLPMQSPLYDAELLAKSGRISIPELKAELGLA